MCPCVVAHKLIIDSSAWCAKTHLIHVNQRNYKVFCYHMIMTKRTLSPTHCYGTLFVLLLAFTALPLSALQVANTGVQVPQIEESELEAKWEPSEQDQLKIKLLSYQYFQAKDNSDYKTAFESFSKDMASAIDFNNWKSNLIKFYGIAGTLKSRTLTRITWYNNPTNAAVSGIFAAVDYSSTFANINVHCGYLMWHKKDDGNFELIREEQNYLDTATQKKLSDSEVADIKAKFGCRES